MVRTTARAGGLALLVAATLAAGLAPAQTTLRYKFKAGDTLPYVMEQKMDMNMDVGGNQVKTTMGMLVDFTWNTNSVDKDGKAHMTQKMGRIRFNMDMPMGKVEFDSQNGKLPEGPIGQLMGPVLQAMAGSEFSFTMDPQGKISDLKVPEKLVNAIKNMPGGAAVGGMFSEEGLKQMVGRGGLQLPAEPVTKGKSWEQHVEFKMPLAR